MIDELTKWMADRMIGHSPPPEGDLKDIDDPKVGETWIQAIAREIEEEGGTLEAAIRVVADRMWNSMMGFLEERWPGAARSVPSPARSAARSPPGCGRARPDSATAG